jgi:hypothetical protein
MEKRKGAPNAGDTGRSYSLFRTTRNGSLVARYGLGGLGR